MNEILQNLIQADEHLLLFLNGLHHTLGDFFMYVFTGKFTWVPLYAALLFVLLKSCEWKMALCCILTVALAITFADQICATAIRPFVGRLRPSNLDNPISEWVHIVNNRRGGAYGFPSCHGSNSFALAFIVAYLFRNRWLTLFFVGWATINSYSRIYLGLHYPGDILVGAILGGIGSTLIYYLFRLATKQKKIELKNPQYIIYTGLLTMVGIFGYALVMTLRQGTPA